MSPGQIIYLKKVQDHCDYLTGSDNRIQLELVNYPYKDTFVYTRTRFEDHPDPVKRHRMQVWSVDKLGIRDTSEVGIAKFFVDYWNERRKVHHKLMSAQACDCTLNGDHETWCHKWEAY